MRDNFIMTTQSTRQKGSYHHGNLAQTLISATVELLSKKGSESLSLREVARIAGVSHGAPAHHFGDKAGLLTAVAIEGHQLLAKQIKQNVNRKRTAQSRLIAAGDSYIRFAIKHPGHFTIMFQSTQINRQSPDYQNAASETLTTLSNCVADLTETQISAKKLEGIVMALWSQVHGFSTLWLAGNFGDPNDEKLLKEILPEMLNGIMPKL